MAAISQLDHIWNRRMSGVLGAITLLVTAYTKKLLNALTTIIMRGNFHNAGKHITIQHGIYYQNPSRISLGDNVFIGSHTAFVTEAETGILEIDEGVIISDHCLIDFSGGVHIGAKSQLSRNVTIETHDHGLDPRSKPQCQSLIIGKNVWIGMNSLILADVGTIGDYSVIAAGSVVTKPILANMVVGGIPAKPIHYRKDI